MALNVKEISRFVLPLVQNGKEEEASNLLARAAKGGGGLLDTVGGLLGGLLGSGDAGPLSGLASVIPALLKLIKPEHAATVAGYLTELVEKQKKAPAKKPAAKKPAAKKTVVKKTTAAKKPAAKKTTATRRVSKP